MCKYMRGCLSQTEVQYWHLARRAKGCCTSYQGEMPSPKCQRTGPQPHRVRKDSGSHQPYRQINLPSETLQMSKRTPGQSSKPITPFKETELMQKRIKRRKEGLKKERIAGIGREEVHRWINIQGSQTKHYSYYRQHSKLNELRGFNEALTITLLSKGKTQESQAALYKGTAETQPISNVEVLGYHSQGWPP